MLFTRILLLIEQLVLLMSSFYNIKISYELLEQVMNKSKDYIKWTGLDLHQLALSTFVISSALLIHIAFAIICTLRKRWNYLLKYHAIGYSVYSLAYANIIFLYFCVLINFIGVCRAPGNQDGQDSLVKELLQPEKIQSSITKLLTAAKCLFDEKGVECSGPSTQYFCEIKEIILQYATYTVFSLLIQIAVSALVTVFCYCLYKFDGAERLKNDTRKGDKEWATAKYKYEKIKKINVI